MNAMRLMAVALLFALAQQSLTASERPSIVVIVADDLGYGDVGYHGNSVVRTPHIDSIARNGVRCTAGYAASPVCSPSRMGLVTGKYPTRFGVEHNAGAPGAGLPTSEITIADRLRDLGYATAVFGKWDLGHDEPCWFATSRGFDEHFGTAFSSPLLSPVQLIDTRCPLGKAFENRQTEGLPSDFYLTTACATRAVAWMRHNRSRPLFLYLPFNAVHDPLEAPKSYLDRFAHLDEPERTFCATLSAMDDGVGMVLDELRRSGRFDNTLVFFTSDNGAPRDVEGYRLRGRNAPFSSGKGRLAEGGIRVPFAVQWPAVLPAGTVYDQPVISLDILPTAVVAAGGTDSAFDELDGANLATCFTGKHRGAPHTALYWRKGEQYAIRRGRWKLVSSGAGVEPQTVGLYHLEHDPKETTDLSLQYPKLCATLRAAWESWNERQAASLWPEGK